MNPVVWAYISLVVFGLLVFMLPIIIILWRYIKRHRHGPESDERTGLLKPADFIPFKRKKDSEQADFEFLERCARKQNENIPAELFKLKPVEVSSDIEKNYFKPTMNPCGTSLKLNSEQITEKVVSFSLRRRSSLPNLNISESAHADNTLWKSGSPDPVKALDEVFMADFGSNLGYKIEILPPSVEDSPSVHELGSLETTGGSFETSEGSQIPNSTRRDTLTADSSNETQKDHPSPIIRLPDEVNSPDIPCTGLIVAELDIQWPKVNCRSPLSKYATNYKFDQIVLKVVLYEVHCILALGFGQHYIKRNENPSQFYVKARLLRSKANGFEEQTSTSSLSLDQFTSPLGRNSPVVTGRTPVKKAFRTLLFKHCIRLPIPLQWMDYNQSGGSLPLDLKLKLDLKECLLQPDQPGSWGHLFKNRNVIATAEINLNSQLWKFFQRREILSIDKFEDEKSITQPNPDDNGKTTKKHDLTRLVFAKPLIPKSKEKALFCVGKLSLALQIRSDQQQFSFRLINAEMHTLPRGTKQVFARCTLMTNQSIVRSFDTDKTMSTISSFGEVQFKLDNLTTVSLKPEPTLLDGISNGGTDNLPADFNEICLLIVMMAKIRSHIPSVPLGRCVMGAASLAYGSGLKHWQEACAKDSELVRATHSLF